MNMKTYLNLEIISYRLTSATRQQKKQWPPLPTIDVMWGDVMMTTAKQGIARSRIRDRHSQ